MQRTIIGGYQCEFDQAGDGTWSGIFLGTEPAIILGSGDTLEEAQGSAEDGLKSTLEFYAEKGWPFPSPAI